MNTKQLKDHVGQVITLKGWVANRRESKTVVFINLRDGQGICQCILGMEDLGDELFQTAKTLGQESSVSITGKVVEDTRQIGGFELHATDLKVYQNAKDYPISNKEHGIEFLIDHRHLWLRSRRQWAIMRIRNSITYAIHNFFQEQGFIQMDAPIFTGNAAEGTTDLFETDYYGKPAYLTQSGQLYGEAILNRNLTLIFE